MAWIGLLELIVWAVFIIVLFEKGGPKIVVWLADGIDERDAQLKKHKERAKK